MKSIEYEKITIENIESAIKSNYITEVVCDADTKTINIKEEEWKNIEQLFKRIVESFKPLIEAVSKMCEVFTNCFKSIAIDINYLLDKRITKKKFIKLLQSNGIQRNTINGIVKNNKDPYTYKRLYFTLNNFKR